MVRGPLKFRKLWDLPIGHKVAKGLATFHYCSIDDMYAKRQYRLEGFESGVSVFTKNDALYQDVRWSLLQYQVQAESRRASGQRMHEVALTSQLLAPKTTCE